jgi:hypothetical protein
MACNRINLEFWGSDGSFICTKPATSFNTYYIDGDPTILGTKVYSDTPCDLNNNASQGYYSYIDGPLIKWFFAEKDLTNDYTEITLTGECGTCFSAIVEINDGITYFDCCGNFVRLSQGSLPDGSTITYDPTQPYTGIIVPIGPTSLPTCPTPTPTPTPQVTPSTTPSITLTPTQTPTKTVTPTPSITPSNSPINREENECIPKVIFPMGISCRVLQQPTTPSNTNGSLEIIVTGGTSPYSIYWQNGNRTKIINNLPGGSYPVTVVDFYGDYTATTTCALNQPIKNCELIGTATKV